MKKIQYEVTGMFGGSPKGQVRDAYIVYHNSEEITALVYHPSIDDDTCASMEFCREDEDSGNWIAVNEDGYINFESQEQLDEFTETVSGLQYELPPSQREEELREQIKQLQEELKATLKE